MALKTEIEKAYGAWLEKADADPDLIPELKAMNEATTEDAFWRNLSFGTAGLRGIIGAGTNRMNVYTVSAAAAGLASYVLAKGSANPSAAIAYDTRNKSLLFAKSAAATMASMGVKVFIYPRPMPVPCLSFAVRELACDTGIMITASHNPAEYNGFKAYGPDGCQLTEEGSEEVSHNIERLDIFDVTNHQTFDELVAGGMIEYVSTELYDAYRERIRKLSCLAPEDRVSRDVKIVYTPLNGTGLDPVMRTLHEAGYSSIIVVEEQRQPDGNFPTCPYPNPEKREALALGMKYAERIGADLLLATDPDCDRVGIAVRKPDEEYVLLSGNQTGVLLLDYICHQKTRQGIMPHGAVFVKSIVSTDLTEKVAASYGVGCVDVLTGFKYIGGQVTKLADKGRADAFLFGFEESYGYLSGDHVREKDGVNASFLIAEMFSYWKSEGVSLWQRLQSIYEKHGYVENVTCSYVFEGESGFNTMRKIMQGLHAGLDRIGELRVTSVKDYTAGIEDLPKADVLKYTLEDGSTVIIRPSGTEPLLKAYFGIPAPTKSEALTKLEALKSAVGEIMK